MNKSFKSFSLPSIGDVLVVEKEEDLYDAAMEQLETILSQCTTHHPDDFRVSIVRKMLECLRGDGMSCVKQELLRLRKAWSENCTSSLQAATTFQRLLTDNTAVFAQRYIIEVRSVRTVSLHC